jgi:dihydroorotase
MSAKRTLIHNAKLVNEDRIIDGAVLIENDKIAEIYLKSIDLQAFGDCEFIDANHKYLMPGVIDDQVHFREPGLTHKGDIHSESKAGIAGGVTSFMEMPNTVPQTTTQKLLEEKFIIASRSSLANYSFYLGATNDNIDEILATDPKTVCGIKLFMGASTGNMLVDNPATLEQIFKRTKHLVAIHSEDEETIQKNILKYKEIYGENVPIGFHPEIRSEEACFRSSQLAVNLANKHNTRLHILHLSTARELQLLRNDIPLEQKRITSEVCVHHLWFNSDDYKRLGALIKWNPAIKTETDRLALIQAVLDDTIDIIATDHAPHTLEEKGNTYFKAPSGGPLVQHSLVAMLELYRKGIIRLEQVVDKMCHKPAILFKVSKRGFLRKGYYADLVLVDLNKSWTVTKQNVLYKCGWSPFEGNEFNSQITHTFVNGTLVYKEGDFTSEKTGMRLLFDN